MENGSDVTLIGGTNVTLSETGTSVTINATGDGTGTDDQNLTVLPGGANTSVLNMENGSDVTLIGGTNVTLSETGTSVTINATGDGTGTDDQNLSVGNGSASTSVIQMENGNNITLTEGTGIQLTESGGNNITISSTSSGGDDWGSQTVVTSGGNISGNGTAGSPLTVTGDGTGTDDQNLTVGTGGSNTSVINIENGTDVTIAGGSGVSVTESGSTITIAANGGYTGGDDVCYNTGLTYVDGRPIYRWVFDYTSDQSFTLISSGIAVNSPRWLRDTLTTADLGGKCFPYTSVRNIISIDCYWSTSLLDFEQAYTSALSGKNLRYWGNYYYGGKTDENAAFVGVDGVWKLDRREIILNTPLNKNTATVGGSYNPFSRLIIAVEYTR